MIRIARDTLGGTLAIALLATSSASLAAASAALTATVVDQDGEPVPDVAVIVRPDDAALRTDRMPGTATLVQENRAFVPHILVVQTGTVISFPNHDEFLHHVYSFSEAKRFEFPLYGGAVSPSLEFDVPGIVTLGCNIHDSMVGYIVVADSPFFALTDAEGRAQFGNLPAGSYTIETWTPRIRPDRLPPDATVELVPGSQASVGIAFTSKLRPPYRDGDSSLTWDRY